MTKAEFITKSGMKIILEGTSQELAEAIEEFERKERREEERRLFIEKMNKERARTMPDRNKLVHEFMRPHAKVTDILIGFIKEGFFDEPRKIGEIMMKLQKQGFFVPTSTIHPLLGRLVLKQRLARNQTETGVWQYFKAKEEKK